VGTTTIDADWPSAREEVWNTAPHAAGLALSLLGLVVLVVRAAMYGSAVHVVSCAIYGVTLVAMYASSTFYHGARAPARKRFLKTMDHCAIYFLIAGTYTPFTLVLMGRGWGWALFGLVWGMTLLGVLHKVLLGHRFPALSMFTYLLMGWLVVIAAKPLLAVTPYAGVAWLAAGGLAYTAGTIFYAFRVVPYNHAVWHFFVLAGSLCHYIAVVGYVIPGTTAAGLAV